MRILWGPAYELGILVIDQQHKRIVDYINELDRLADQPDARQRLALLGALNGLLVLSLNALELVR